MIASRRRGRLHTIFIEIRYDGGFSELGDVRSVHAMVFPQRLRQRQLVAAAAAAFCTYFCMYAFRKPFTAGTFEDQAVFGFGLKSRAFYFFTMPSLAKSRLT
jgi:hypothetical protein